LQPICCHALRTRLLRALCPSLSRPSTRGAASARARRWAVNPLSFKYFERVSPSPVTLLASNPLSRLTRNHACIQSRVTSSELGCLALSAQVFRGRRHGRRCQRSLGDGRRRRVNPNPLTSIRTLLKLYRVIEYHPLPRPQNSAASRSLPKSFEAVDTGGGVSARSAMGGAVARCEIVTASGALERVYFRIPSFCQTLTRESKDELLWGVDRDTPGRQIQVRICIYYVSIIYIYYMYSSQ